jgi:2,4-dichlorophenol 6-monooxygenase
VLLVRPDNYVAFRSAGAASDTESLLVGALQAVLDRAREVQA